MMMRVETLVEVDKRWLPHLRKRYPFPELGHSFETQNGLSEMRTLTGKLKGENWEDRLEIVTTPEAS